MSNQFLGGLLALNTFEQEPFLHPTLLAFLKEEVVFDPDITTRRLITVKTPSIPLPTLNDSSDILVMTEFHTFPVC